MAEEDKTEFEFENNCNTPLSFINDNINVFDISNCTISHWLYLIFRAHGDSNSDKLFLSIRQNPSQFLVLKGNFTFIFDPFTGNHDIFLPYGDMTSAITQIDSLAYLMAGFINKTFDGNDITSMACYKDQAVLKCQASAGYSDMYKYWEKTDFFAIPAIDSQSNEGDENTGEDNYKLKLPQKYYTTNKFLYIWPVFCPSNSLSLLQWYCLDCCPTQLQILTQL